MSVAVVITDKLGPANLIARGAQFARARGEDLLVLQTMRRSGEPKSVLLSSASAPTESKIPGAVAAALGDAFVWWQPSESGTSANADRSDVLRVAVKQLLHPEPDEAVLVEIAAWSVSLLIVPRPAGLRFVSSEFEMQRHIFRDAPCETMQLRITENDATNCRKILVPAGGGHYTATALKLAVDLADAVGGQVTALYVEPNVDDVAELVGMQILDRTVAAALGSRTERVEKRVALDNNIARGIATVAGEGHDLMLMGVSHHGVVHRLLFRAISEELMMADSGPPVAVIRTAMPLTSRLRREAERLLKSGVPQLGRSQRVALVERVQSSSRWDFDFVALVCLSTMIAALGLIQNSAAVVIGAMLVAPLMTPLLGAGLSLVQGNVVLVRNSALAVLRGFLLAVAISVMIGLLVAGASPTAEMLARGSPRIPDLLVAFLSGIAAAYAIGRRNLLSALPGVAIAAALVPPIATCGLAVAMGHWKLAIGSALLFLTNIVAIVLGAACSLWAAGIRGSHEHGSTSAWARGASVVLILVAVGLAVYEALPQRRVPPALRSEIVARIEQQRDAHCLSVSYAATGASPRIDLVVAAPQPVQNQVSEDLASMVRDHFGQPVEVRLETRLVQTARAEP